ncbi:efflux RND transporter periplasmic adaptor subunit [Flavihumibacter profundi]|uniref:efflux RND transporter periplasmic adaptor subunit n=1 Tax=Flavihumibacter profundi TaxID=2716883 RepID=UPI001CC3E8C0|nr:efflux RND transporter periplasmic adaptor subunit [Flavihumibacter profundi]MBZ5857686.1 efflux RND transporter periplasmic adaptor subunit [Flavihumibacter profundi]
MTNKLMTTKMKGLNTILAILTITCAAACNQPGRQPSKDAASPKADSVAAFLLQTAALDKTFSLPGELLPNEKVLVYGKVSGYVKKIFVDIGSPVKQGQVIALLDAPEMQSKIAESKQRLESVRSKWVNSNDVYKRLSEAAKYDGVIAPTDLERAKNQVASDAALLQAAQSELNAVQETAGYLTLRAPFAGTVTKRNVDAGAYVGKPGEMPLFEIEDNSVLRLRISIPEALTGTKVKDEKVLFTIKAIPGKKYEGKLYRKSGSLDINTRSEIWEFMISNTDRTLKPGMFADCKLNIQREGKSFFVPYSALVTTLEKKFVIKVRDNTTSWVDVGQGINLADKIEIFGALNEGDTLVMKANEELKADTKLVIKITRN